MEQYDDITVQMNTEDIRKLDPIKPFPMVLEALTEAIENFSFTRRHSDSDPKMAFNSKDSDDEDEFEFFRLSLPRIFVQLLDWSRPRFLIRIDIPRIDVDPSGAFYQEKFNSSDFCDLFMPFIYASVQGFMAVFEVDVLTFARLITYYLILMGFTEQDSLQVNKNMDIGQGDMSLAIIPDDLTMPETFRRATAKLLELDVQEEDSIYLRLSASDSKSGNKSMLIQAWKDYGDLLFSMQQTVGDKEALEHRRSYRNFDCINYYIHTKIYKEFMSFSDPDFMMRFLTDYFLFIYPNIRQEDIVASIVCLKECCNDDTAYIEYSFNPDGNDDSPEKLEEFITTMKSWRKSN